MAKVEPFKYPSENQPKNFEEFLANLRAVFKGDKGDKGGIGKTGPMPSVADLLKIITPLIPEPIPGDKGDAGDSYILTEEDKEEIAAKIDVPVVEKVIEKIQVVKEKKVVIDEKPEKIRDKLESLKEKLSIQAIEGLAEILKEINERNGGTNKPLGLLKGSIHTSKSKDIRFKDDETPTGTIDGVNTDFVTSKTPLDGSLKVYRGGARQRVTEDYTYTVSSKTISFTIPPQVGEVILVDYRY